MTPMEILQVDRKRVMKGRVTITEEGTVQAFFNQASQEIEMLGQEMRDWSDNMSGTGLESTQKAEQVEEAADSLENAHNTLEEIDIPQDLQDKILRVSYTTTSRKYVGRHWRLSQAIVTLQAVEQKLAENKVTDADPIGDACQELEDTCSDLDSVEFPGMYG